MSAERAGYSQPKGASGTIAFKVPLFRSVIERFDADRRFVVLDLGYASSQLLALLTAFRCRLEVACIGGENVRALNAAETDEEARSIAESLLPPTFDEAPDIVLCWDLLNYLEKPAITALMGRVAARVAPAALAHALIDYSARSMPEEPRRLVPLESLELSDRGPEGGARIPSPRYSPEELGLALDVFRIDRGVLLTNGMQEFLLRR